MSAQKRLDEMLETYLLASGAIQMCPDTAAQNVKDALVEAFVKASDSLNKAILDGLTGNSAAMTGAVSELSKANVIARKALADAQQIAKILEEVQKAAALAVKVAALIP